MKRNKSVYDIEDYEEYKEERFDKLEEQVLKITRNLNPIKVFYFKMYYGIGEHRFSTHVNSREISEIILDKTGRKMHPATILRWINEIMTLVKKELKKQNEYRNIK